MSGLVTAQLYELDDQLKAYKPKGKRAVVQFNPETLKVSYSNQIVDPPAGTKSQSDGTASRQFVGAGTTKLALQLWFDVNAPMPGNAKPVDDVRRLTQAVTDLMTAEKSKLDAKKYLPPVVRFEWGSFKFDGIIESLEETLEYFAETGVPLRASMSLAMSQQKILIVPFTSDGQGRQRQALGTEPLVTASQGNSVQGLAEAAGQGGNWQRIAAANGIENPRRLAAGQVLNLTAKPPLH